MTRVSLAKPLAALEAEPDLTKAQKATIVRALRWGWDEVWLRWPEVVMSGWEEEITARLCEVLCDQDPDGKRIAPGLSLFETVQRGGKTQGADGGVEYQPDLVFRPIAAPSVRNRNRWGWFVECKLVDGGTLVHSYCKEGVQRFIDGNYAPRMPSAAMLAYVRDGREASPHLEYLLQSEYGSTSIASSRTSSALVVSCHDRTKTNPPCVHIELTHIWLPARRAAPHEGVQIRLRL